MSAGIGDRLTRKVGPLPVWGWAFLIVGGYLAYRKLSGGSSVPAGSDLSGGTIGTPTDSSGMAGGVGGGGAGLGYDDSALRDLLGQNLAATQSLGDAFSTWANNATVAPPWYDEGSGGGDSGSSGGGSVPGTDPAGGSPTAPQFTTQQIKYAQTQTKASNPAFAVAAQSKSATLKAAGKPAPFGGVVSVKTLKNGSTLTTYASGRQVQQVPGKSAYVVKP